MNIYLAGPMRGISLYNFPMFDAACCVLRSQDHSVASPAENDRRLGFDPATAKVDPSPELLREMVKWDFEQISYCDATAFLPGWTQSAGSRIELVVARALGKKLFTVHFDEPGYLRPLEIQDIEITFKASP